MQTVVTMSSDKIEPGHLFYDSFTKTNPWHFCCHVHFATYPGHLRRWDFVPKQLEGMLIFTDVSDVYFQAPIPTLENYTYVTPEYVYFEDSDFWMPLIKKYSPKFDVLTKKMIFNAGLWATDATNFKSWQKFLMENRGGIVDDACDQLLFNLWLYESGQKLMTNNDAFGCLYGGAKSDLIVYKDGFRTRGGTLISVVHANGNTKELLFKYI